MKPTPFTIEANRIMDARLSATTQSEKDDAEWALTFLFQMNKAGRLQEYFDARQAQAGKD